MNVRVVAVPAALALAVGVLVRAELVRGPALPARPPVRVLFVGNSFTSANDLPTMVTRVARSLGDRVVAAASDPGGFTFSQHRVYPPTLSAIVGQPWDAVVLQEQSELPALPDGQVAYQSTPPAVALADLVRRLHPAARVVVFETWGYRDGDPLNCPGLPELCTYPSMQARLRHGYDVLAAATGATEALVGDAWRTVRASHPEIDLYQPDGKHPSVAGTYLAACVLYAAVTGRSPLGAARLGLPKRSATVLQTIAAAG